MRYVPGRKYVLESAQTRSTSLRTRDTRVGTRERRATMRKMRNLDNENDTVRRTRSGTGRDGDVTRMEGIASSRVIAFSDAMTGCSRDAGVSWDNCDVNSSLRLSGGGARRDLLPLGCLEKRQRIPRGE